MDELHIRSASLDDVARLAELKSTYVRSLYRGFISQDILNRSTPDFHAATLRPWLADGTYRVALLKHGEAISSYIVYGTNPEAPYNGLIYEGVSDAMTTVEEKRMLVDYCLNDLRSMGHTAAYLWILTDNFRVRYLFETLGFRPDGERQTRQMFGQEPRIARYVYSL